MAVTVEQVRLIITTPLSDAAITLAMADAVLIVESCYASAGWSEGRYDAIVRWVTAYLIASMSSVPGNGEVQSESLGDASVTYKSVTGGVNLASSSYGRQAIALDPTGCLTTIGQRKTLFEVL